MKRDSIKNEDYWCEILQEDKKRLERFSGILINETNIERKKTIKSRLEMIRRDYINVMYSAGID